MEYYSLLRFKQARLVLEKLKAFKTFKSNLDIGCGRGFFVKEALSQGYNTEEIDISLPEMQFQLVPDILKKISLEEKTLEGRKYNFISFFGIMEYVADPYLFIKNTSKFMEDRGIIVFSIPMISGPIYWLCELLFRMSFGLIRSPWLTLLQWNSSSPHIFLPTKKGIENLLNRVLKVDKLHSYKQSIIDRALLTKRIKLESKLNNYRFLKKAMLYVYGYAAITIDLLSDFLKKESETLFIAEVNSGE